MFSNLKVAHKLFLGFGVMIILLLGSNFSSYLGVNTISHNLFVLSEQELPLVDAANEMKVSLMVGRNAMEEFKGATAVVLKQDSTQIEAATQEFKRSVQTFDTLAEAILKGGTMPSGFTIEATSNTALIDLITEADRLHNNAFQVSASRLIEAGTNLVTQNQKAEQAMAIMEASVEDVLKTEASFVHNIEQQIDLLKTEDSSGHLITHYGMPLLAQSKNMMIEIQASRLVLEEIAQAKNLNDINSLIKEYQQTIEDFDRNVVASKQLAKEFAGMFDTSAVSADIMSVDEYHASFQEGGNDMIEARKALVNASEKAEAAMADMDKEGKNAATILNQIEEFSMAEMIQARNDATAASEIAVSTIITISVVSVIVGFLMGGIITRSITGPLGGEPHEMMTLARNIANGDLRNEYHTNASANSVYGAMRDMSAHLKTMIDEILQSSTQLASVAEQTSAATQQTRQAITEQHRETDQVAAAIHEMSATVQEIAYNTSETAQASELAQQQANAGSNTLNKASDAISMLVQRVNDAGKVIGSLHEESQQIGQVLAVIQGIAEQTNLLALNAAIEAARAGDQGRGFAVVADEVRTLAQRTQESASDIQKMVSSVQNGAEDAMKAMVLSQEQASSTLQHASETSEAFNVIFTSVDRVGQMALQIAAASEEQSQVAEEINRNIVHISELSIQTSSSAEQISSATNEVAASAEELSTISHQFKL